MAGPNANQKRQEPPSPGRQGAPPGQFISDQHAVDCRRFLEDVKLLARRRFEAGLTPGR